MNRPTVLCVVGPTACHKTDAAIFLAKALDGQVVSADSVQVYQNMDIGSAKPTMQERQGIPHHMLDCVAIDAPAFSVAQYRALALNAIEEIVTSGQLPVVVGGSGLYVNALTAPLNFAVPADSAIRAKAEAEYDRSPEDAFQALAHCDPVTAERLHINDKKRVVRALEVYRCSGKPLSAFGNDFTNQANEPPPCNGVMIGLNMPREQLYRRIDARVDSMLQAGLLSEAETIYHKGYSRDLPAMQSIGYKQLFDYFDGQCTLDEAVETIKRDTRRFAKRQITWFKRDTRIRWFDVEHYGAAQKQELLAYAKEQLSHLDD